MRNIQSDGAAEDMIRSFVQVGCAEVHLKTIHEKTVAELENADPNEEEKIQECLDKISQTSEELNSLAELRRSIMLRLFNMYEGDKDYWCMVKHLGIAAYTMFESYQASEDDPELYKAALEANRAFITAMTHFLGMEITDCAACFADALKAERKKNDEQP